jgi:hypothetical protein
LNDSEKDGIKKALRVKDTLVDLARQRLPSRVGDKYTEVVVTCLTCLDDSNTDFGDNSEFEDADGVLIGVRFIEKVRYYIRILVTRCSKISDSAPTRRNIALSRSLPNHQADPSAIPRLTIAMKPLQSTRLGWGHLVTTAIEGMVVGGEGESASESEV